MIKNKKITALIPVREGSRRLKNKNILPFSNSNLLIHKIRQLKKVAEIDKIIVSSNSPEMLKMAQDEEVLIHKRPDIYCDEKSKTFNEVVEYISNSVEGDVLIWAPCVCPLCGAKNYSKAIACFNELVLKENKFDSVISAKLFKEYLYDKNGPINFEPDKHVPSQNLPDWKVVVNGFFIAKRENMAKWKFVYGKNPYLYTLEKQAAIDIDDNFDYDIARALFEQYGDS